MNTRSCPRALVRALLALLAFATVLAAGRPAYAIGSTIIYVVPGGAGAKTGADWANANDLAPALAGASGSAEIWVAAGTYKPTSGTDKSETFALKNDVAVYGGFAGNETQLNQRNWRTNVTILSGDIGTANNNGDNSYHVVTGSGTDATAILDGFTVTGGNASVGGGDCAGARCGGGMLNIGGSPTVTNVTFSGNNAFRAGGGMYNGINVTIPSSPTLTNVIFSGNTADTGGGIENDYSNPILLNVVFSGNRADKGGALYNAGISPSNPTALTNATFNGNSANQGGAVYNVNSRVEIRNSILWGDSAPNNSEIFTDTSSRNSKTWVYYSIVQGSGSSGFWTTEAPNTPGTFDGGNNLDTDPMFQGAPSNLRLQYASSAINKGNNTYVSGVTTDLDGNPRIVGGTVDMGAYESPCPAQGSIIYVNGGASGANTGASWTDAYTTLTAALAGVPTTPPNACAEIWVAQGTYTPTTPSGRDATFTLKSNVAIYGGFTSGQTLLSQRNWRANVTTLSGNIGTSNDTSDNSYHVVTGSGTNSTAILDGFTVTGGNASVQTIPTDRGGGMYTSGGSPSLTNILFSGNSAWNGAGMYSESNSRPTLTNVSFISNSASSTGGGLGIADSSTTLTNVTFSGNSAFSGGALYNESGSVTVTNGLFSGNSATGYGGGVWNNGTGGAATITFTNVTFGGNSAQFGGALYNAQGSATIRNSILWGDGGGSSEIQGTPATVTNSIVQGGYGSPTDNNLDADPKFITPITASAPTTTGNLRLLSGSPAFNAGNNSVTNPSLPATDLDGAPRIAFGTVDMGAYETQIVASPTQSPAANSAGWNNTDVTVTWNWRNTAGAVPASADCPATSASSGEGTLTVTGACKDANGSTGAASYTVKVDKTAPTVTLNSAANSCDVPGSNGWCRGTQTAGFSASDSLSGVASPCTGATCNFTQSTTTNGSGVTISSGQVCDVAGNCASSNAGPFKIDSVAPTNVSGAPTTPPNGSNGWYKSSLQVQFAGSDPSPGSGIASCSLVTYSGPDGASVTVNGSCTDYAGNTSNSVASSAFKYDATGPTLNPTISPNSPVLGGTATASPNAGDATSGIASQSCDPVNTSSVGAKTLTCTATDNAGNTNSVVVHYSVGYAVSTVSPIVAAPSVNSLYLLGIGTTATPIKWTLKNAAGTPITAAGTVTGIAYKVNPGCGTFPTDPTGATAASVTGTNPKYDTLQKAWVYNWILPGRGCYSLFITLNSGQTLTLFYHSY
ncbi:MAG: choice-of-anchor Q domain-containing protein [Anaerolineae bacterium]